MKTLLALAIACGIGLTTIGCGEQKATTEKKAEVTTKASDGSETKTTVDQKTEKTPTSETKTTTEKAETKP